jgi:hypothetical protein
MDSNGIAGSNFKVRDNTTTPQNSKGSSSLSLRFLTLCVTFCDSFGFHRQLSAANGYRLWSIDTDPHLPTLGGNNRNCDVVSDGNALADLPSQY